MARGLDINADYNDPEDDDDGGGAEYDMRVSDWEDGLPSADDLTPLSQPLIPPELASAFSITPEPSRTLLDVHRASQTTITTLSRQLNPFAAAGNRRIPSFAAEPQHMVGTEEDDEETDGEAYRYGDGGGASGSSSSAAAEAEAEDGSGGALLADMSDLQQQGGAGRGGVGVAKRARLVWTPQLHRRFVEVVAHLGVANAVPKTIMQLMNVEGLTRENVASHLQKYRLYLKRTHGHEDVAAAAGPSTSASFASSAHPRQQQQQQPQQRFAGSTEGSGSESMVRARARAPPPHPSTSYAIPQPVRHGHGGLDLEQPRDWPHGSTSNAAVLAFPHRARVAPK